MGVMIGVFGSDIWGLASFKLISVVVDYANGVCSLCKWGQTHSSEPEGGH